MSTDTSIDAESAAPDKPDTPDTSSLDASVVNASVVNASVVNASVVRAGRTDGITDVDPELFTSALHHDAAKQRFEDRLEVVRERLRDVAQQIDDARRLARERTSAAARIRHLTREASRLEQQHRNLETGIEATEQEQLAKKKRGSLLYGTLYTIAGVFFIAGDVIMSREIVANALKLPGTIEPWVFAIGLAMLAILIKPAYDRLVEDRYWDGRTGWFTATISVCATGALATLWILGAFRSTAFVSNAKMQRLTTELLQTQDPGRIAEIEAQVGMLQQSLIASPLGYWAFVLSGVLFALAGAVSLGIGLRHFRDAYHLRWSLHRTHRKLSQQREATSDRLAKIRQELRDLDVAQETARHSLDALPTTADLLERRSELREREQRLLDNIARSSCDRLDAMYRRSYAQGQAGLHPADRATDGSARLGGDGHPDVSLPGRPSTSPDEHGAGSTRPSKHPDETLRDMLRRDRS
jgi:predicted nuclease with TOPRIM domain